MSRGARVRLHLLCEGARDRRFLEALCDLWGIDAHQRNVVVVPPGTAGDAKNWIRKRYTDPEKGLVRLVLSKNFQAKLGLLVMIDGDNLGYEARKRWLDDGLEAAGRPRRGADDRIAVFSPSWSLETWLLWLWGEADVDELASFKEDGRTGGPERAARFRAACKEPQNTERSAANAWNTPRMETEARVPSLADARIERRRLP